MNPAILDAQTILQSIIELRKSTEETRRSTEETRRSTEELKGAQLKTDEQMRKTDEQMRQTDQQIRESQRKTDDDIRKLAGLFTTQWGKLVEALVEPGTVALFQQRGLLITKSHRRSEGRDASGSLIEIDVLLVDGDTVVAIEVKTTCRPSDIEWHLDKLGRFKQAFSEYADKKVQGAIAALTFESESNRFAYKNGLWVLRCVDGVTTIANDQNFVAKSF